MPQVPSREVYRQAITASQAVQQARGVGGVGGALYSSSWGDLLTLHPMENRLSQKRRYKAPQTPPTPRASALNRPNGPGCCPLIIFSPVEGEAVNDAILVLPEVQA